MDFESTLIPHLTPHLIPHSAEELAAWNRTSACNRKEHPPA